MDEKSSFQPWPHQVETVEAVLGALEDGQDRVVVSLAPGTGRLWPAAQLATNFGYSGRVLVLVHRLDLQHQWAHYLRADLPGASVELVRRSAAFRDSRSAILVSTVQMARRASKAGDLHPDGFGLVIVDGCEMSDGGLVQGLDALKVGFTDFPDRRTLDMFGVKKPAFVYSIADAVRDGVHLPSQFISYSLHESPPHVHWNEAAEIQLQQALLSLLGNILGRQDTFNAKTLVAVKDVGDAHRTTVALRELLGGGDDAVMLSNFDKNQVREATKRFIHDARPHFGVIAGPRPGLAVPQVGHIVLLRKFRSPRQLLRMISLGARRAEGKTHFTVHDFYDNAGLLADYLGEMT